MFNKYCNPVDIYAALTPTLILTYIVGITPFRIYGSPGKRVLKTTYIGFLNGIIHACGFIYCFLMVFITDEAFFGYFFKSNISKMGDLLQKFTGMAGMTVLFLFSLIYKDSLIKLLKLLDDIDNSLCKLGIFIDYKTIFKCSCISISIVLIFNVLFVSASLSLLKAIGVAPSIYAYLSFFPPHFFIGYIQLLYFTILVNIKKRYEVMNKLLIYQYKGSVQKYQGNSLIKQTTNKCLQLKQFTIITMVSKNNEETIDDCMHIHLKISEASSLINIYFAYQLLTIFGVAFLIIVFDAYYVLEVIFGPKSKAIYVGQIEFIVFCLLQMILFISAIIGIVEVSNNTISESKNIATNVHKLLSYTKDLELKQKLLHFSMQLVHQNQVSFTGAGLFNVDRTLYFTIIGAATTYLIILLQFATSSNHIVLPMNKNNSDNQ